VLRVLEALTVNIPAIPQPPQPSVTAIALAPGSTTYTYQVIAITHFGSIYYPSQTVSVQNVATLSTAAYNRINWNPVQGAVGYAVNRTSGGPGAGVIAVVAAGRLLACEPAVALVQPSFPMMPSFEVHDTGLPILGDVPAGLNAA
jgi:hypothetical protein